MSEYYEGNPNGSFIIVGEAPGSEEMEQSRVFVGPAGRELNKLLSSAGIVREDCFIINTLPYKPKSIEDFVQVKKSGVYPSDEFLEYQEALLSILRGVPISTVIPLGNVALYATTGNWGIQKWRGSILTSPLLPDKVIVPTIHPAAIVRSKDTVVLGANGEEAKGGAFLYRFDVVHDLNRAKEVRVHGTSLIPERDLIIGPTFHQCLAYLEMCHERELVAVDIECYREETSCISFSTDSKSAISIPFLDGRAESYFNPDQAAVIWREIDRLFRNRKVYKLFQNAMFDNTFLFRRHKTYAWPLHDTMIAHGVLFPDFPKDLGYICSRFTYEPYYKDEGKMHDKITIDIQRFWQYNAKDSAVLHDIWPSINQDLDTVGNRKAYNMHINVMRPLMFMTYRGTRLDTTGLPICSKALEEEIEAKRDELKTICGRDINANSPKQLIEYFYVEKKIPALRNGSSVTTDDKAMKKIAAKGYREARTILDIRQLVKLKGTYIDLKLDEDGRLRCDMKPIGTVTGRLSSSQTIFKTGMNMQNFPQAAKRYLLADKGYLLYNIDLGQAENRIVAYIAPEPRMQEAFETGRDVHSLTAALISGVSYDDVRAQYKAFESGEKKGNCAPLGAGDKPWRYWGKQSNHSLNYNIGPNEFAEHLESDVKTAKFLKARYMEVYPGVGNYHRWVQDAMNNGKRLTNVFGRIRDFYEPWGDSLFKEAYAQIPQSTVAHIINEWGIIPIYENQELFRPVELLNQVHDSIVLQISYEKYSFYEHAACILAIKSSLERELRWRTAKWTIPADVKIGLDQARMTEIKIEEDLDSLAALLEREAENLLNKFGVH